MASSVKRAPEAVSPSIAVVGEGRKKRVAVEIAKDADHGVFYVCVCSLARLRPEQTRDANDTPVFLH